MTLASGGRLAWLVLVFDGLSVGRAAGLQGFDVDFETTRVRAVAALLARFAWQ